MRLLIFGASGGTGQQLVRQALARGHHVDAFVRNPAKLMLRDPELELIVGDVARFDDIRRAVPNHDAILSALGTRSPGPTTLLSDAVREILHGMEKSGIVRLLWQSSLGVGDSRGQLGRLYDWVLIPLFLKHIFADKERQEAIIREHALDWTIVRPAMLTNGPVTGRYHSAGLVCSRRLLPRISRADVAHFMLDALERRAYIREAVPLCY